MQDTTKLPKYEGSIHCLDGPEELVYRAYWKELRKKIKGFNKITHSNSVEGKKKRQKNAANNNWVAQFYVKGHFHCWRRLKFCHLKYLSASSLDARVHWNCQGIQERKSSRSQKVQFLRFLWFCIILSYQKLVWKLPSTVCSFVRLLPNDRIEPLFFQLND